MKKFVIIAVAGFIGALAALQLNSWIQTARQGGPASDFFARERDGSVRIVSLEALPAPVDFREAAKRIMPAVVAVDTITQRQTWFGDTFAQKGKGSGVVISRDGHIVTNAHVVEGATEVRVHFSNGKSLAAKIVGSDSRSDLAVLKVEGGNLTPALVGQSSKLEIGEWVIAVGNPLGYENTVSVGVVSSLGRTLPTEASILVDAIQTDAAINQGNSGGALANAQGELVGINSAIASNSGGSIGIGFAIPIDRAKRIVDEILKHGRVRYGWLGIETDRRAGLLENPRARAELQSIVGAAPPSAGLLIQSSRRGSPAERAGIGRFDVILAIDGKTIKEPMDFQLTMLDRRPGEVVEVKFWSRGETRSAKVTLEDLSES
ncbi:MAG TPA: trypsin-like peptidase domain-containing protein [Fimbriimonadaceae bacterium]|nr:trypsin-like peptidase domain-containing protein [Fimbriimonadaceae bacterium]HRJ96432.1 trypsin-like peptidase domain-containing protein [Fimbriimonadaceae bacterium]